MSKHGTPIVELQAGRLVDAGGDCARLYPAALDGMAPRDALLVDVWGYVIGWGMKPAVVGCVRVEAGAAGKPVYRDRFGARVEAVGG